MFSSSSATASSTCGAGKRWRRNAQMQAAGEEPCTLMPGRPWLCGGDCRSPNRAPGIAVATAAAGVRLTHAPAGTAHLVRNVLLVQHRPAAGGAGARPLAKVEQVLARCGACRQGAASGRAQQQCHEELGGAHSGWAGPLTDAAQGRAAWVGPFAACERRLRQRAGGGGGGGGTPTATPTPTAPRAWPPLLQ